MKKSVFICALCIASGITNVFAAEINANVTLKRVDISITDTDGVKKPSLQITDAEKTTVYHMDEGSFNGEKYIFRNFSMPQDAKTGNYIIRLGENGKITEKSFYYVSYEDIISFLNDISKDNADIDSIASANADLIGIDSSDYSAISDGWKKRISDEIKKLDIKTDTEEEIIASFKAVCDIFSKYVNYGVITGTKSPSKLEEAIKKLEKADLKYWDSVKDKSYIINGLSSAGIDEEKAEEKDILDAIDGAVLTAVISRADWGTGKEALNYYADKGLLNIPDTYLNSGADVYKALKNKNISNYKKLPDAIKDAYDSSKNDTTTGGGGSSGGGGGSSSKNRPTIVPEYTENSNDKIKKTVFNDLNDAQWAKEAIEALAERKIVSGRSEGIFAPNSKLTREEFVKLIVASLDLADKSATADFEDVLPDSWSYIYVASAKKAGIVEGRGEGLFGASDPITRQDMAVIICRCAKLFNMDLSGESSEFSDFNSVSDYAKASVKALSGAGIINGMENGRFAPHDHVTRAQGAQVIYKLLKNLRSID